MLGMSQTKLGDALGLTFQQVQKYERGANRIGASRLFELSRILEVPVSYFFEDLALDANLLQAHAPASDRRFADSAGDSLAERETLELVRAYYRIPDRQVRKSFYEMTKSLGAAVCEYALESGTPSRIRPIY